MNIANNPAPPPTDQPPPAADPLPLRYRRNQSTDRIYRSGGSWRWQGDYLTRRTNRLRASLGSVCCRCGSSHRLNFHHPEGKSWTSNQLSWAQRLARYEAEAADGLLELVCTRCHRRIHSGELPPRATTTSHHHQPAAATSQPF